MVLDRITIRISDLLKNQVIRFQDLKINYDIVINMDPIWEKVESIIV